MPGRNDRGVALVLTLLALAAVSALGLGLVLASATDRLAGNNAEEELHLLNAADAVMHLVSRDLAAAPDWDTILSGTLRSTLVDGEPGLRTLPGGQQIDLMAITNRLSCGRSGSCTDTQIGQMTDDRPWGTNNPRWALFAHAEIPLPAHVPIAPHPIYAVVWIGDDARETDGNSTRDDAVVARDGRYSVRARIETFGPRAGRFALECNLRRLCVVTEAGEHCLPGVRVQNWRVVSSAAP